MFQTMMIADFTNRARISLVTQFRQLLDSLRAFPLISTEVRRVAAPPLIAAGARGVV